MIDLRSDTVTRPTPEMLSIMTEAPVGDDVFGEDPTINALEERVAAMFGKQAGLFVPSGTMGNQLGLFMLTDPCDEIITDESAHIFNYEAGGCAFLSGVQLRPLPGINGILTPELIEPAIRTRNDWDPHTRVIGLENTTNRGGGACYTADNLTAIRKLARRYSLSVHLDGARIWNAMIATGIKAEFFGEVADTISVCFSKGLGAPVGSMLLADRDMIRMARRMRKVLGGGMRQAGLLAAAARYALDYHYAKLEHDHRRAAVLAREIDGMAAFDIRLDSVQTNIVIFDTLRVDASAVLGKLENAGIAMVPFGPRRIRAVFHHQITDQDLDKAIDTLGRISREN
ncbi:MAG: low specificity L-threonine aldolase [Cyclonatronaceae bacterium]